MPCDCSRCRALPFPPTTFERWLCQEGEERWPWWVFGGVVAALGLLLVTASVLAAVLVLTGVVVAAMPVVRQLLLGCARTGARPSAG